jgi:hypothetical protein
MDEDLLSGCRRDVDIDRIDDQRLQTAALHGVGTSLRHRQILLLPLENSMAVSSVFHMLR